MKSQEESRIQQALIRWFDYAHKGLGVPDHRLLYAVPNQGQRSKANASRMKSEGLRAGVSDLVLAVPCNPWCGMYLELKTKDGKATPEQKSFLDAVSAQGYLAIICRSYDDAVSSVESYLKSK